VGDPRDGYIWDYCKRAGVSYRTYVEFADEINQTLKYWKGIIVKKAPSFDLDIKM